MLDKILKEINDSSYKIELPSIPKLQYLYYVDDDIIECLNGEKKNISQEIRELKEDKQNLEEICACLKDRIKKYKDLENNINDKLYNLNKIIEYIDKTINICHDNKSCDTCKFYCGTSLCTTKKNRRSTQNFKRKKI